MGMKAVGSYLRILREAERIGRGALAQQINTDDSQIERIEKGKIDTRGSLLFAFIRAVRGNAEHVMVLLLDEAATEADGQVLAKSWLRVMLAGPEALDERRRRLQDLVDELLANPHLLDQLIRYGNRLREELRATPDTQAAEQVQRSDA